MATLDELSTALRNADAAGDADAARMLAAEISKMQGGHGLPMRMDRQGPDNNLLNVGADIARVGAGGLVRGAMAIPDVANLARSGFNAALDKVLPPTAAQQQAKMESPQPIGSKEAVSAFENATGLDTSPESATTTTGKMVAPYVKTASEFVPMSVATGGGAIAGGVLPGLISEGAGQAAKKYLPAWAETPSRIAGALLGAPAAARVVTPNPASPAHQRLVDVLAGEGVTGLTAGQKTGSEALRYQESALGNAPFAGGKTNKIVARGQQQFDDATVARAGINGPAERAAGAEAAATPEVLAANQQRLTDIITDLTGRNTMRMDQQFANDVRDVIREYGRVLPSEQRERLYNIIQDLAQHGNAVPGPVYQSTRSRLSTVANDNLAGPGGDREFGRAMTGLRAALDNAMGRSISPADQAAWQAFRRDYGAQEVIKDTMSRAGEAAAHGHVSPLGLRGVVSGENRGAYALGRGPFSELARAGAGVMAPMPQSGTAPRGAFFNLANYGTAGALPAAAGRVLMSPPMQAYLANQVAPYSAREALQRALLQAGAQQTQAQ